MPLTVTADNTAKLAAAVAKLLKSQVLVGIPDSTADRQPEPGEPKPASNAVIGYVQEFGDPEKNIPPRPFLVPGVEGVQAEIVARMQATAQATFDGADAVEAGFVTVGIVAQNAVQQKITDGPFAPLSDRTIEARARRGRKGAIQEKQRRAAGEAPSTEFARPLIDTGQLRRAVRYQVKNR